MKKKMLWVALAAATVVGCSEKIDIDSMKVEAIDAMADELAVEFRKVYGDRYTIRLEPLDLDGFGHHPCVASEGRAECRMRGKAQLKSIHNGRVESESYEVDFDDNHGSVAYTLLEQRDGEWRVVGHRAERPQ